LITWDFIVNKNFRLNDAHLHPTVAQKAWEAIYEAWQQGIYVLITQGYRSIAEQDALYAKGRTTPGPKVTNAKGGESYHNFGLAVDFCLMTKDGKVTEDGYSWDDTCADWKKVVQIFKAKGFKWGGDFKSFKDTPHFEMTFGFSTAQLQAGKRPAWPVTTVKVPEPPKAVATIVDKKEEEYVIPKEKADKIIANIQGQWKEKDAQIKQYQAMWQAENAKPDKCPQKLDEFHKAAEALRKEQQELADWADEIRKASGQKVVNN
jgi:peptidoglycan L-alanyl-D-glutamate endopeptidase CwlK